MVSHDLRVEPKIVEIPRLLDWIQACCRGDGLAEDLTHRMTLILEEAVVNVIAHGFQGVPPPHRIAIHLDVAARLVTAEVTDNGRRFDPTTAPGPDLSQPPEQRDPGGLGIHLMRRLADRIEYRRDNGNNILRLEKTRD